MRSNLLAPPPALCLSLRGVSTAFANLCDQLGDVIRHRKRQVGLTTFFGIGKLASSVGQTAFGTTKLVNHIMPRADAPDKSAVVWTAGGATAIVTCVTRINKLYHLLGNDALQPTVLHPVSETSLPWPLRALGNGMIIVAGGSAVFASLSAFLGGNTIGEHFKLSGVGLYVFSGYVGLSNFMTNCAFNLKKSVSNFRELLVNLNTSRKNVSLRWPKRADFTSANVLAILRSAKTWTAVISVPGVYAYAALGFFYTRHTLKRDPFNRFLSNRAISGISMMSIITAFLSFSTSRVGELYKKLDNGSLLPPLTMPKSYRGKAIVVASWMIMGVEILSYAGAVYIANIDLLKEFNVDERHPALQIGCDLVVSGSGAFLHYMYTGLLFLEIMHKWAMSFDPDVVTAYTPLRPLFLPETNAVQTDYGTLIGSQTTFFRSGSIDAEQGGVALPGASQADVPPASRETTSTVNSWHPEYSSPF